VARTAAYLVIAVVLAAVLLPLRWPQDRDSFPLSNYPMFARGRRSPELKLVYAVAIGPEDRRTYVPPELVANREVLQARAVLARAASRGVRAGRELCESIARRVAAARGALAGAGEIRIVRGRHDSVRYFETGELGAERVLARCQVPPPRSDIGGTVEPASPQ
jgi:hypothetical protein